MVALERDQLLNVVSTAIDSALRKGAEEAEVYAYQGLTRTVGIERGQIMRGSRIADQGIGVRIIINRAVGFAYTNDIENKASVDDTISRSIIAAKASRSDPEWHGLQTKKPFPAVQQLYDPKIKNLESEDLVQIAERMLDSAQKTDKRAYPIEGGAGASCLSEAIANSNGVEGSDRGTVIECSLATLGTDKGEVTPACFEFNLERKFRIDPEWVGSEAAKLAASALGARRIGNKMTSVVFTQTALHDLLSYTLINSVKADYVQRNQSALRDKVGKKVASENLTVHDDGLLVDGLRTSKFDGEGCPQQKTVVIEEGILRGFIYDSYTAKREGRESTGNAGRSGYISTPRVEATNFHISPGRKSANQLLNEVDDGLLVFSLQGAHSSNPASGEFSVVGVPSWKIEKGKIAYPVKAAMLAGNVFDVIQNVTDLADNERKIGQLVAPWVLVENVKVIGR